MATSSYFVDICESYLKLLVSSCTISIWSWNKSIFFSLPSPPSLLSAVSPLPLSLLSPSSSLPLSPLSLSSSQPRIWFRNAKVTSRWQVHNRLCPDSGYQTTPPISHHDAINILRAKPLRFPETKDIIPKCGNFYSIYRTTTTRPFCAITSFHRLRTYNKLFFLLFFFSRTHIYLHHHWSYILQHIIILFQNFMYNNTDEERSSEDIQRCNTLLSSLPPQPLLLIPLAGSRRQHHFFRRRHQQHPQQAPFAVTNVPFPSNNIIQHTTNSTAVQLSDVNAQGELQNIAKPYEQQPASPHLEEAQSEGEEEDVVQQPAHNKGLRRRRKHQDTAGNYFFFFLQAFILFQHLYKFIILFS